MTESVQSENKKAKANELLDNLVFYRTADRDIYEGIEKGLGEDYFYTLAIHGHNLEGRLKGSITKNDKSFVRCILGDNESDIVNLSEDLINLSKKDLKKLGVKKTKNKKGGTMIIAPENYTTLSENFSAQCYEIEKAKINNDFHKLGRKIKSTIKRFFKDH